MNGIFMVQQQVAPTGQEVDASHGTPSGGGGGGEGVGVGVGEGPGPGGVGGPALATTG
jgi:hypothetical protein